MTAVSRCVSGLKGSALTGALLLTLSVAAKAQEGQPDGFHVGDRIALSVEGAQTINDTLTVRDGLTVRLANLGDIALTGVKRTDIQTYLTQQIGKFIRNPVVHATALVRIAVLGQVARPGFYVVPSDILLSDVVMRAGGPAGTADLSRTVVRRGNQDVMKMDEVASALSSGATIDQLRIAPGDEVVVGEKQGSSFDTVLKVLGVAVPLLTLGLYFVSRK
jgi:polysaccharide export outer membrane protein